MEKVMANSSPNSSKIIRGYDCHIEEYPYMVLIALRQIYKPLCGGTILSPFWILTAGHCLFTYPQNYVVFTGLLSLSEMDTAQRFPVSATYRHPEYRTTSQHDIGLLMLQAQLYENGKIQFIALSFESFTPSFVRSCFKSTVMGYGLQTRFRPDGTPIGTVRQDRKLNCAYLTVLEDRDCDRIIPRNSSEFCAIDLSSKGQDCCYGDSGGPIICNEKQIGIISKGFGCGLGLPVKFTKVYLYRDFIEDTMANSSLRYTKIKAAVAFSLFLVMFSINRR